MRSLRNNGLSIALLAAFLLCMVGMAIAGHAFENQQLAQHGLPSISIGEYLKNENFLSALFENWESEWLQMAAYVVLTAYLFQKGSAESRDPDAPPVQSYDMQKPNYPVPFGSSALLRWIYRYSLGLVLVLFFCVSFVTHLFASYRASATEAALHKDGVQSLLTYFASARFWFESFQNWQSEFFSTAMLVVLSIYLRYKGSPESKPLDASKDDTGH